VTGYRAVPIRGREGEAEMCCGSGTPDGGRAAARKRVKERSSGEWPPKEHTMAQKGKNGQVGIRVTIFLCCLLCFSRLL